MNATTYKIKNVKEMFFIAIMIFIKGLGLDLYLGARSVSRSAAPSPLGDNHSKQMHATAELSLRGNQRISGKGLKLMSIQGSDRSRSFSATAKTLLDASSHLYMRVCPSIRRSVGNQFILIGEFH